LPLILLVGDRAVERDFSFRLARIKIDGRIGLIGDALRERDAGREAGRSDPAAAPRNERRLKNRCSGVARLSGISQPRRRITFMGLIPPEWLWKEYGPDGSQASHGMRE
jgi:hypothetical protein